MSREIQYEVNRSDVALRYLSAPLIKLWNGISSNYESESLEAFIHELIFDVFGVKYISEEKIKESSIRL